MTDRSRPRDPPGGARPGADQDAPDGSAAASGKTNAEIDSQSPMQGGTCSNCAMPAIGRYCSHCGQSQLPVSLTLIGILTEALSELLEADSRLNRTLAHLLFFPGRVTDAYFAGKRVRYLPAFRVYLIASVLLFLLFGSLRDPGQVLNFDTGNQQSSDRIVLTPSADGPDGSESSLQMLLAAQVVRAQNDPSAVVDMFWSLLPQLGFVLLPFAALSLQLLYVRKRMSYGQHFIMILHTQSGLFFWFVLMGAVVGYCLLAEQLLSLDATAFRDNLRAVAAILAPLYVLFALRAVYGGSTAMALLKLLAFTLLYGVFLVIGMVAISVLALLTF